MTTRLRLAITADLHWGIRPEGDAATRLLVSFLEADPPDVLVIAGDVSTDYNRAAAAPAAMTAATTCSVLTKPVQAKDVSITVGSYRYDATQNKFIIDPVGKQPTDAWSLVRATVAHSDTVYFAKIFNFTALSTQAVATAATREVISWCPPCWPTTSWS